MLVFYHNFAINNNNKLCFSFIYCTRYFSCSIAVRRKSILYYFLLLFLSLFMTLQNQIFFEAKGYMLVTFWDQLFLKYFWMTEIQHFAEFENVFFVSFKMLDKTKHYNTNLNLQSVLIYHLLFAIYFSIFWKSYKYIETKL